MNTIRQLISFSLAALLLFTVACKKDKASKTGVPELTTTEVTNILAITAMSGGTITSNGGHDIAATGVCWSKANNMPTISDDTTKNTNISSGSFTAMLKNLTPSATYYVRAYATNREGTGYGNVITFSTGNGAPVATEVAISGTPVADALLTGNYTYTDAENNTEQGTIFQWYVANDGLGAGEAAIAGATAKTFRVQDAQQGKYIRFGVTPKASTGNLTGVEVKSAFIGAVGEGSTVTFTYNGAEVTYGILISAKTGKKWLDRNLGAGRLATEVDDYQAYGDLFQWGRAADGHQLINRTGPNDADATGINGITSTTAPFETSSSDVALNNKFVINPNQPRDWRIPQNNNLWQGVQGVNNPCPAGWRIPTMAEWGAEDIANGPDAFTKLKLTFSGQRNRGTGMVLISNNGIYWSSESTTTDGVNYRTKYFSFDNVATYADIQTRAMGHACRCIKN